MERCTVRRSSGERPGPIVISTLCEFPNIIKSILKLFADDAKIYQTTDKCDILQSDLHDGSSWADQWELKFHVDKCGVMHYGRTNENHSYKMNSRTLKAVSIYLSLYTATRPRGHSRQVCA